MKEPKQKTRRLHLLTNPKHPDVFMGMSDDAAPELAQVIPTPLADSYWDHPSHLKTPAAS